MTDSPYKHEDNKKLSKHKSIHSKISLYKLRFRRHVDHFNNHINKLYFHLENIFPSPRANSWCLLPVWK